MTESEIAAEADRQAAASCGVLTEFDDLFPPLPDRIAELEGQLAAMTAERNIALLRMEVAIATSHAWIDAEVRRRIAEATDHAPRAFPASALRQQRQSIGLLSTADAGRVRLGGYAPSLPPR